MNTGNKGTHGIRSPAVEGSDHPSNSTLNWKLQTSNDDDDDDDEAGQESQGKVEEFEKFGNHSSALN